jgi:Protein of unknown function (DUF2892)
MKRNVGTWDRVFRAITGSAMLVASGLTPVPLLVSVVMAVNGVYLVGTSLVGSCLGYRLMGRSTCPVQTQ